MKNSGASEASNLLPNFLIIGAAKAGTTAMYRILRDHPDIFMPDRKEPRYFSFAGETLDPTNPVHKTTITDFDEYKQLFVSADDVLARGEASPSYLHNPKAPARIKALIPNAKLIAILRNPADRAYSHFMHFVRVGLERTTNFEEALANLDRSFHGSWKPRYDYLSFGFYGEQLARYTKIFPRSQIKVVFFEDFNNQPNRILGELFNFLGVDRSYRPTKIARVGVSGIPRFRRINDCLKGPSSARSVIASLVPKALRQNIKSAILNSNLSRPPLELKLRRQLIEVYSEDIMRTEKIVGKSLRDWLDV